MKEKRKVRVVTLLKTDRCLQYCDICGKKLVRDRSFHILMADKAPFYSEVHIECYLKQKKQESVK